jgi:plastocyanin
VAEYAGVLEAASVYVAETDKSPELNSLVLSPSVVIGGSSTQGTVALPSGWRAGTGGALVTLASGDLSRASVPASVLIPEGANSTTFPITTQPVSTPTWLPIFASRSITLATRLTLLPVGSAVSSLTLSPTSVSGGSSAQGTVTLNFTAPAGGIVVKLASSNTAVARVPASVTVPAGATSASFTVTTSSVASNTTVVITATMADTSQSANLTVTAPTGPLPAPTLMFPSNGARFSPGQTITFDWSDVSGAASYTIQIDDSNTFSAPQIVSQTVTPSTYSTSTLPTKKMWWRVRANDAAGNPGAWSTVREIEVKS